MHFSTRIIHYPEKAFNQPCMHFLTQIMHYPEKAFNESLLWHTHKEQIYDKSEYYDEE